MRLLLAGAAAVAVCLGILCLRAGSSRQLTFAECRDAGGRAWRVDTLQSDRKDSCPDGKEAIGMISDAAIWFQCCK